MKIKQSLRVALQTVLATFFVALLVVTITNAATTIGNNVSTGSVTTTDVVSVTSTTNPQLTVKYDSANYWTQGASATGIITFTRYGSGLQKGFTFADTVAVATSTAQTLLTVDSTNSSNASTTLAVYQFGTGDIFRFYDGGTLALALQDGGALTATSTANPQLTVKYDANNYWTEAISSTGALTFNVVGSAQNRSITLADPTQISTSTTESILTVDSTNSSNASTTLAVYTNGTGPAAIFVGGTVGVASSTPYGLLAIEQGTEARSFFVGNQGSSTPSFMISGVNGDGRVGVATSSPFATFSVGASTNNNYATTTMFAVGNSTATTTIDFGKACFRSVTAGGAEIFWYFTTGKNNIAAISLATSTTSCF